MTPPMPVWVCAESVDFRLGIDGLALKVQASLGPQRALNAAHVFFNRGRDKVKILWYDRHGWWLLYKRLECGRFFSYESLYHDLGLVKLSARTRNFPWAKA